jgi:hypothetical protein
MNEFLITMLIVGICVVLVAARIVWEIRTKQPHSDGEAVGGWFGGTGESD